MIVTFMQGGTVSGMAAERARKTAALSTGVFAWDILVELLDWIGRLDLLKSIIPEQFRFLLSAEFRSTSIAAVLLLLCFKKAKEKQWWAKLYAATGARCPMISVGVVLVAGMFCGGSVAGVWWWRASKHYAAFAAETKSPEIPKSWDSPILHKQLFYRPYRRPQASAPSAEEIAEAIQKRETQPYHPIITIGETNVAWKENMERSRLDFTITIQIANTSSFETQGRLTVRDILSNGTELMPRLEPRDIGFAPNQTYTTTLTPFLNLGPNGVGEVFKAGDLSLRILITIEYRDKDGNTLYYYEAQIGKDDKKLNVLKSTWSQTASRPSM